MTADQFVSKWLPRDLDDLAERLKARTSETPEQFAMREMAEKIDELRGQLDKEREWAKHCFVRWKDLFDSDYARSPKDYLIEAEMRREWEESR